MPLLPFDPNAPLGPITAALVAMFNVLLATTSVPIMVLKFLVASVPSTVLLLMVVPAAPVTTLVMPLVVRPGTIVELLKTIVGGMLTAVPVL